MAKDDEDAWRAIVDNYGDRPELEPDDEPAPEPPRPVQQRRVEPTWDDPDADWSSEEFVPPEPPPLPSTTTDRYVAWCGVLGAPALLLVCLVLGVDLGSFLAYVLVAAFVGGFLYLVVTMNREPRDPDDDGAVL